LIVSWPTPRQFINKRNLFLIHNHIPISCYRRFKTFSEILRGIPPNRSCNLLPQTRLSSPPGHTTSRMSQAQVVDFPNSHQIFQRFFIPLIRSFHHLSFTQRQPQNELTERIHSLQTSRNCNQRTTLYPRKKKRHSQGIYDFVDRTYLLNYSYALTRGLLLQNV
jgi:hypothetical protein